MTNTPNEILLAEIDAFIAETEMGVSYFGKVASGNSEIVKRLRAGGRVWPETEAKIRDFMRAHRAAKTAENTA